MQKTLKYTIFKTKWGYFGLAGTEYGLLQTHLPGPEPEKIKSQLLPAAPSAQHGEKNSTPAASLLRSPSVCFARSRGASKTAGVNRVSSIENQVSGIEFDKIFFKAAQEQITAYFDGTCVNFSDVPIAWDYYTSTCHSRAFCHSRTFCHSRASGNPQTIANAKYTHVLPIQRVTEFTKQVLTACRNIGFGRTISYSRLAKKLGRPAAARAVGTALAKNPLPLIIPCHRIVRSDGKIGGFSAPGGKDLKAKLLKHEHAAIIHCKSL